MSRWIFAVMLVGLAAAPAVAQLSVSFQQGVNGYSGTLDTTFRAAVPIDPDGEMAFVSVDEFDGGFQTQGALRFENLFGSQSGQVPEGVTIAFATLTLRITSSSDMDAVIGFNRVLPASPWDETSTWLSLGGDLEPDSVTGLLDGDPILQDGVESLAEPDTIVPMPNFSGGFLDIDVTDSVVAWYGGAPNHGWAINNNTGNGWDFQSSEFVDDADPMNFEVRPKLTIGYFLVQGDLDFDGDVDLSDYEFLLDNLAIHLDQPIDQGSFGDLDFDRDVDLDDFAVFKEVFPGGPAGLQAALAGVNVPEPSTAFLVLFAASGLALATRRITK